MTSPKTDRSTFGTSAPEILGFWLWDLRVELRLNKVGRCSREKPIGTKHDFSAYNLIRVPQQLQ